MRKILLSLFILGAVTSAKAQSDKDWEKGYCYDLNNHKINGYFYDYNPGYGQNGAIFSFKKTLQDKPKDYVTNSIRSIVILKDSVTKDSFVVSHAYDMIGDAPLLRVETNGPVKIYACVSKARSPYSGTFNVRSSLMPFYYVDHKYVNYNYFYGKNPENIHELKRKNFTEAMNLVMADRPEMLSRIKSKMYRYEQMRGLIDYYNTGIFPF